MPWTKKDAGHKTKKASTPKKKKVWAKIANERLSKGASEGSAIRQANAAIANMKGKRKKR